MYICFFFLRYLGSVGLRFKPFWLLLTTDWFVRLSYSVVLICIYSESDESQTASNCTSALRAISHILTYSEASEVN